MANPQQSSHRPATTPPPPPAAATSNGEKQKERTPRKVFVIFAPVMTRLDVVATPIIKEFKTRLLAEEFLNSADAPKDFDVIVGQRIERKQKVTLR